MSKRIAILYGSETGNSYDFASILSNKLHRLQFQHTLISLGEYNARDIMNCRFLFVICSTTGQGDFPRNVIQDPEGRSSNTLWNFLKQKNLPNNILDHISLAMLGVGDSSYPKFNYGIRKLHKRMVDQLGACEIFPRLEADELGLEGSNKDTGYGIESVYFEFEKHIIEYLLDKFPTLCLNGETITREIIKDDIYIKPENSLQILDVCPKISHCIFSGDSSIKCGKIISNKRLTHPDHFQDVRQLVIETDNPLYYPGDTLSIYPYNTDRNVMMLLDTQPHWKAIADNPLEFTKGIPVSSFRDGGLIFPLTLRNILKYHCDIMSIPRKGFFIKIWTFATDASRLNGDKERLNQQRNKLRDFATNEDMQDLFDYCNRPKRSLLEVLQDFESLQLPWEYIFDYMPLIKPRQFSISSKSCDKNIELTIAIVRYNTILRKVRKGLCTNYIANLLPLDTVRYKIQNKYMFKDEIKDKPIIMISPGVGLAPMKAVIQSNLSSEMYLFFGNRMKNMDFLYKDELLSWTNENKIKLFTCFSRDTEHSPNVRYVQDLMWMHKELLANLLVEKDATVYICGSSGKMPVQVRLTLIEILKGTANISNDVNADSYLKHMENSARYFQETW